MQVTGKFSAVVDKVKTAGPLSLYNGAIAAASATFVGHYPWFFTYNFLSEKIPKQDTQLGELGRRAILGFCSSAVSDTCSNSIRVVKVYKQSYPEQITYVQVVRNVIQVRSAFARPLQIDSSLFASCLLMRHSRSNTHQFPICFQRRVESAAYSSVDLKPRSLLTVCKGFCSPFCGNTLRRFFSPKSRRIALDCTSVIN